MLAVAAFAAAFPRIAFAADSVVENAPRAAFQPDDISIGEPIALPFGKPAPTTAVTAAPTAAPAATGPAGWLGMSVAESAVPGRWAIVDVVPAGPAATAGIAAGDELRGINGHAVTSADDVSQALTAITAGQRVRLTVARSDQVRDVDTTAVPRPGAGDAAAARDWRASPAPDATPDAVAPATVSVLTNPPAAPPLPAASPLPAAQAPPAGAFVPAVPSSPAPSPVSPIAGMPAASPAGAAPPKGRTALGVRTVPIDREIQDRFRLPDGAGAYVVGVVGDLPASKAGIPPGSVIVSLADRPVRSPQELTQLVAAGPTNRPVPVQYVLPGGTARRAEVVLQALELPLEQALVGEPSLQPAIPPALESQPAARTARRQEASPPPEAGEIRREMGRLRGMLDALERRLDRLGR